MVKRVVIESPFSGDVEANTVYARECLRDSIRRGEAPLASHLLYTQVLDDTVPEERKQGMEAGWTWNVCAELVAVYTDRGITRGMQAGIDVANDLGIAVEYRSVGR